MGNTPIHSKRRLSGESYSRSCENETPPHVSIDIPAYKRIHLSSKNDVSFMTNAPSPSFCSSSAEAPTNKIAHDVEDVAHLLRVTSLQGESYAFGDHFNNAAIHPPGGESLLQQTSQEEGLNDEITPTEGDSHKLLPTVFRWDRGGDDVYISGTFNGWSSKVPLVRRPSGACAIIDCPPGKHEYKYFVDGAWYHHPNQPTVHNKFGTKNNVIEVKESDFDVQTALEHDIAVTQFANEPTTFGRFSEEYGQLIPNQPRDLYPSIGPFTPSNVPHQPGIGSHIHPPLISPTMMQGILNKETNIQCDPNLLPPPNHVMVNHLYALSIKDGVMVLSVITRFRQKAVSTLFYKPIQD